MKVEYDKGADALYMTLRKGRYNISEEISDEVIIDLDRNCRIIGREILGVSKRIEVELLSQILGQGRSCLKAYYIN